MGEEMRDNLVPFFVSLLLLGSCGGGEPFQGAGGADGSFRDETEAGVSGTGGVSGRSGEPGTAGESGAGQAGSSGAVGSDAGATEDVGGGGGAEAPSCERRVLQDDITNARDLGGQPLSGGRFVACRRILRGGTLASLSLASCPEFASLGIKTVIDLREPSPQQALPAPSCVQQEATVIDAAMPKLLPDTPDNYLALFDEAATIATIFDALGRAESYPVYIHCVIGRDRASLVAALVLLALGAERQTVIDEFRLSAEAGVPVKPECIEAVLDAIDGRGGIEAYLTSIGVSAQQLEVLRAQAIAE